MGLGSVFVLQRKHTNHKEKQSLLLAIKKVVLEVNATK
jgi:hypothetical protein